MWQMQNSNVKIPAFFIIIPKEPDVKYIASKFRINA
jgi:hypothetical protein